MAKAMIAVDVKSNKPIGGIPRSSAICRTSTFVVVPMLVSMPPARMAKFTGIKVFDAG
jgi:hypothetical protein